MKKGLLFTGLAFFFSNFAYPARLPPAWSCTDIIEIYKKIATDPELRDLFQLPKKPAGKSNQKTKTSSSLERKSKIIESSSRPAPSVTVEVEPNDYYSDRVMVEAHATTTSIRKRDLRFEKDIGILDGTTAFVGDNLAFITVDLFGRKRIHILDLTKGVHEPALYEISGMERITALDDNTLLVGGGLFENNRDDYSGPRHFVDLLDIRSGDVWSHINVPPAKFGFPTPFHYLIGNKDRLFVIVENTQLNTRSIFGLRLKAKAEDQAISDSSKSQFIPVEVPAYSTLQTKLINIKNNLLIEKNKSSLFARDFAGKVHWSILMSNTLHVRNVEIQGDEIFVLTQGKYPDPTEPELTVYSSKSGQILRRFLDNDGGKALANFALHPNGRTISLYYYDSRYNDVLKIRSMDQLQWSSILETTSKQQKRRTRKHE